MSFRSTPRSSCPHTYLIKFFFFFSFKEDISHETGYSGLVHWDNPEGWDGEGGGMGVQDGRIHVHPWLIHVNVWQKPLQYRKVISLQLK